MVSLMGHLVPPDRRFLAGTRFLSHDDDGAAVFVSLASNDGEGGCAPPCWVFCSSVVLF